MANGHGGPRTPAHPAPVSGPGAHSQRTDGGPGDQHAQALRAASGQDYGDRKSQIDQQRISPLSQATMPAPAPVSPATTGGPAGAGGSPTPPTPFGGPSTRPGEPVTQGVAIGPGAGPEALSAPVTAPGQQASGAMTQLLQRMSATDTTGVLAQLYQAARSRGV